MTRTCYDRFAWCFVLACSLVAATRGQEPRTLAVEEAPKATPSVLGTVTPGKRWALLVGVSEYPQTSESFEIPPLKAATKDVEALATFLSDPAKGGFAQANITVLTDEKAKQRDILITFNELAKRAAPDDLVLFYFSGHGYKPLGETETTYLVPYDVDMRDLDASAVNYDDLSRRVAQMEARKVVVILDACHAGGVKPKGARAAGTTGLVQRYLDAFQKSEGRALLLSSDESEVSWEEDTGGVFTAFLLKGLNGDADVNRDGLVTFTEASLYVEKGVPEYTRSRFPKVQKPTRRYESGPVRGDIPLAVTPAFEARTREARELRDARLAAVSAANLPADLRDLCVRTAEAALERGILAGVLTPHEERVIAEVDGLRLKARSVSEVVERLQALLHPEATPPPKPSEPLAPPDAMGFVVSVQPEDADVTVTASGGRGFAPESRLERTRRFRLTPGRYTVAVSRKGYRAQRSDVDVTAEGQSVDVALELAFGTLALSVAPNDAAISLAAKTLEVGSLPDEADSEQQAAIARLRLRQTNEAPLATGTYTLTASKKGHKTQEREFTITDGRTTTVSLSLPREGQSAAPDDRDARDDAPSPLREPTWVNAVGEAYLQYKTAEEAQQIALRNAYKNAVELAVGIRVDVTETRIVADSDAEFRKAFTQLSRSDARGVVVKTETPRWSVVQTPSDGGAPILGYRVEARCLVAPDRGSSDETFRVVASLNRETFRENDECVLSVTATRNAFLTLFNVTSDGRVYLLIPTDVLAEAALSANQTTEIPSKIEREQGIHLRMRLAPERNTATESFFLVATKTRWNPPRTAPDSTLPLLDMNQWLASIPRDQRTEDVVAYDIRKETAQ
ncbi:DUF4384 domain-containing protein [Candidatus Poribacteria bacterium]|nr:DUF4384 domain-containing protein [Candidatus Poribacteria bacterium]